MIEQLPFVLKLSDEDHDVLNRKKPWSGKQWGDSDFKDLIKPKIRSQLNDNQNSCAYCGLPFKGEKDKQIEHIAPKASFRYPEFTFELRNLVLSCIYCNDLMVKGTKITIREPRNINYDRCVFLIIHPYFDNPDDHIKWVEDEENDQVIIQIKNNSAKAIFSISMFDLNSTGMTELRASAAFRRRKHKNTDADIKEINKALEFKK